jgi:hypothetical protein
LHSWKEVLGLGSYAIEKVRKSDMAQPEYLQQ